MKELSAAELDALITEATVDAYTEDEELTGFAATIRDNLAVPFETARSRRSPPSSPAATSGASS